MLHTRPINLQYIDDLLLPALQRFCAKNRKLAKRCLRLGFFIVSVELLQSLYLCCYFFKLILAIQEIQSSILCQAPISGKNQGLPLYNPSGAPGKS